MIKAKSNTNNNFWETRRMVPISNKPRKYQVYFSETQLKVITNECNFSIPETLLSFINSLRAKLACLLSPFSRVWLCDPMDHGPPGSPVHGILQASILEWMAISFSSDKVWSEWSEVAQLCLTLWPHGLQPTRLLCPWDFPGKSTGVGCHFLAWAFLFPHPRALAVPKGETVGRTIFFLLCSSLVF